MNSDTRSSLIDVATGQVRRQGYSAFSYADLAEATGLRKPSIHHHFPAKEDLGAAIVAAYAEQFSRQLDRIESESADVIQRLQSYARLYREGLEAGQGCLCGVLASEIAILPTRIQACVRQFFSLNLRWLERILRSGSASGVLREGVDPKRDANTVLATLQGAMFVALAVRDPDSFDDAVAGLLKGLRARRGR